MKNFGLPALGAGAGLRHQHFDQVIATNPPFNWFEIITEDFLGIGGYVRKSLHAIRERYTVIPHGVGLSIGSTDPLDVEFLQRLRLFLDEIKAPWYSDHLCFTMVDHANLEDLMPLPFTEEAVGHIASRVRQVQDILGRPFLLENVTRYVTVSARELSESEFINEILREGDCGLLLDVTNAYLNSQFHGFDPLEFIKSLPLERVGQMHLAGWDDADGRLIDSHDAPVPPQVWDFFKQVVRLTGPSSVLIEWDKSLPAVERLLEETIQADAILSEYALDAVV